LGIIQLISDFQTGSFKIGLLHSKLLQALKDVDIIDVSHDVKLQNIVEASFILKNLQTIENQSSVVLVNVGLTEKAIIYQHHKNWYILPDNGLIGLVFDIKAKEDVYTVEKEGVTDAIQHIFNNETDLLLKTNRFVVKIKKQPMINDNMIVCERIFTDRLGNCYFNLTREIFESNVDPLRFSAKIQFVRDTSFDKICEQYMDVNPGDSLLKFNKAGFLKLSINQGSAAQLFRIKENSQIIIYKL
jgi:S-adenosylmethionine hydrolase